MHKLVLPLHACVETTVTLMHPNNFTLSCNLTSIDLSNLLWVKKPTNEIVIYLYCRSVT